VGNQKWVALQLMGLNEGLAIPHPQKPACYGMLCNDNRMVCTDQINLVQDMELFRAVVKVVINR